MKKELSSKQQGELISILKSRFEKNASRHKNIDWNDVEAKLNANTAKCWSLNEMEKTSGEPDVVGFDKKTGEFYFCKIFIEIFYVINFTWKIITCF